MKDLRFGDQSYGEFSLERSGGGIEVSFSSSCTGVGRTVSNVRLKYTMSSFGRIAACLASGQVLSSISMIGIHSR